MDKEKKKRAKSRARSDTANKEEPFRGKALTWIFTWNNWTPSERDYLKLEDPNHGIKFIQFTEEFCPTTGTPHLQGYVHFNDYIELTKAKKLMDPVKGVKSKVSLRPQYGNNISNDEYTSKTGNNLYRWGTPFIKQQGKRTDWKEMRDHCGKVKNIWEFSELYPEAAFKYPNAINSLIAASKWAEEDKELAAEMRASTLRPFQQELVNLIESIDRRSGKVIWIHDDKGQSGKTFLGKWFYADRNAYLVSNSTTANIACGWNAEEIAIFDFSRDQGATERMNIDAVERISCGVMFSGKYNSRSKVSRGTKTICTANCPPPWHTLSVGRWIAFELVDGELKRLVDPRE